MVSAAGSAASATSASSLSASRAPSMIAAAIVVITSDMEIAATTDAWRRPRGKSFTRMPTIDTPTAQIARAPPQMWNALIEPMSKELPTGER